MIAALSLCQALSHCAFHYTSFWVQDISYLQPFEITIPTDLNIAVEPATEMAESSRPETAEEPARIAELPIQTAQSNSTIQLNSVDNLLNAKR